MNFSQEKVLANINKKELAWFLTLASLAILIPIFIHVQWFAGPMVNAIFVVTLFLLGVRRALAIAIVPSLIALSSGTLPAVLAPAVPFIMISNIIYILSINYICANFSNKEKGYWQGILLGSSLKFVFLFLSSGFIIKIFTSETVAVKIGQMMTWTQFATAVMGGMIAWIVLRYARSINN